jgi:hypothetical protein
MILLTPSQRARLLANGRMPDADHIPVVKFFNPFVSVRPDRPAAW